MLYLNFLVYINKELDNLEIMCNKWKTKYNKLQVKNNILKEETTGLQANNTLLKD